MAYILAEWRVTWNRKRIFLCLHHALLVARELHLRLHSIEPTHQCEACREEARHKKKFNRSRTGETNETRNGNPASRIRSSSNSTPRTGGHGAARNVRRRRR